MGSLFKSFIKSNGCTSTCGPEITFLSREMDGTKPLIRHASPTSLLSLHKGSATKCYHHDFKTQTATSFNSIREHFSVSVFMATGHLVVQLSIFRIRSPGSLPRPSSTWCQGSGGACNIPRSNTSSSTSASKHAIDSGIFRLNHSIKV